MKKGRDFKDFGELYQAIGEKNFGNVAYVLILLMIFVPFVAGIVNRVMLYRFFHKKASYFAYDYNYKCMTLWNVIFVLMLLWVLTYAIGRIKNNTHGFKSLFLSIYNKQPWLLWWLALLIWTIIPVAFSIDPFGSVFGIDQLAGGYISHIFMFGVLGCAYMISDNKQKELVVWMFIASTDVLSAIMLAFEYDIPFLKDFSAAPGVSVYTNSNHYGYIITMAYMAITGMYFLTLFEKKSNEITLKKVLCWVSFIIHAFAMVVNDTLGSYLAIMFTVIVMPVMWAVKTKKFKIHYFVPIIIMIAFTVISYEGYIHTKLGSSIGPSLVVFVQDLFRVSQKSEGYEHAGTDRIGLWIETIKKIKESPIVGYGPDIVVDRYNNWIIPNTPHNEFLECAFFMGIPGLILYLGGLIHLCVIKIKEFKVLKLYSLLTAGVVIGYLASSFFGVRKFNTVCYFFMFIGLLVGGNREPEKYEMTAEADDTKQS